MKKVWKKRLEKVEGGFNAICFHEEYESAKERREACKGAKSRQPTGKARGYILVDSRDPYHMECYGSNSFLDPGDDPMHIGYHGEVKHEYLWSQKCRRVGASHMPKEWLKALLDTGWFKVIKGVLYDVIED